jgi:hypothetical protein
MSTRNWTLGSIGRTVAALVAMVAVTACDPYMKANTAAPFVVGVIGQDINYNGSAPPLLNGDGCTAPYPEPNEAWANATFPATFATVAPVTCFPPRMGPGFAPYYMGNLGGSYQTNLIPSTFTYELPLAYVLTGYPIYVDDQDSGTFFDYSQIKIVFNKLMNPKSIQPDPNIAKPPATLKIFEDAVERTESFSVVYNPNSETDYWGAAIDITAQEGLNPNARYRIIGVVEDQQGNQLNVDVTVFTVAPIVIATPPPVAVRAK